MGLIIVLALIILVILYVLAEEFMEVALMKGYSNRKYFWYCFLFGLAGYLIVIALPIVEKSAHEKDFSVEKNDTTDKSESNQEYIYDIPDVDFLDDKILKQCSNCGIYYDSACKVCPVCKYTYNK